MSDVRAYYDYLTGKSARLKFNPHQENQVIEDRQRLAQNPSIRINGAQVKRQKEVQGEIEEQIKGKKG
jgi:hypothetical protein